MVSNLGRNVAPDPWTDFGSSGSKAQDASWINPTAIDMTQYDTILVELEPGDAIDAADLEVSLRAVGNAGSNHVQFGDISLQDMKVYTNEPLQQALADGVKQILVFGGPPFSLLGIDALYVNLTNKNASAKEMDGIRYRRVGFHPAG